MIKSVMSVLAVVTVMMSAGGVALAEEGGLGVDVSLDFYSKYVWRGLLINDDLVFQPDISMSFDKFTFGIWGSVDMTDYQDEEWEFIEYDFYGDYTTSLLEGVDLSLGIIQYSFPSADDTTEIYAGLAFDLPLAPSVTVYHDFDAIDGTYIQFAVGHTIEKLGMASEDYYCDLAFGASVGYGTDSYNEGYFGVDDGGLNDLTLSVSLPICFPGGWTLTPSLSYAMMLDSDIRAATDESDNLYSGIGLSKSF